MRRYETTFIVNPQSDDAAIDRQVAAVSDLIKNDGGQILHERRIGTRRLAYPIDGLIQGFYASFVFDGEASVLPKLERHYKLEEPYIRYLTIRYDGKLPEVEGATESAVAESSKSAQPDEPKSEEPVVADSPAEPTPAEEEPAPAPEEPVVTDSPAEPTPVEVEPAPPAEEPAVEAADESQPAEPPVADQPDPSEEEL